VGVVGGLVGVQMIVDVLGALGITKVPLLWGHAPLYPKEGGFWDFFHEGRLEVAMLCGSVFLLIVGSGALSLDARMAHSEAAPRVTGAAV
jgi:putative oxidoreductase